MPATLHRPRVAALEMLGDLHPLVAQLGAVEGLVTLQGATESLQVRQINDRAALRDFLREYRDRILCPLELPAIRQAYDHAGRNEVRELIARDRELSATPLLQNFAAASRRVGASQLQQLRPLRDQRVVQRYLAAIEKGEAHGWHTLIYGLTLSIYSLPLRQGLYGYAHQSIEGFLQAAARGLKLSGAETQDLFDEHTGGLPATVEQLLRPVG